MKQTFSIVAKIYQILLQPFFNKRFLILQGFQFFKYKFGTAALKS